MNATYELIRRAQAGERAALEEVVEANLRLAWHVVSRFQSSNREPEELFQVASLGLFKAVERFDLERGLEFSTYAVPCMIGEIRQFLRSDQPVHLGRTLKERALQITRLATELEQEGTEPTVGLLAAKTGLAPDEIVEALEASQSVRSLSEPQGEDLTLGQMLSAAEGSSHWTDKVALATALGTLDPQMRTIIALRFFKDLTQAEIAEQLGISQVQVSRLQKRALSALKAQLVG